MSIKIGINFGIYPAEEPAPASSVSITLDADTIGRFAINSARDLLAACQEINRVYVTPKQKRAELYDNGLDKHTINFSLIVYANEKAQLLYGLVQAHLASRGNLFRYDDKPYGTPLVGLRRLITEALSAYERISADRYQWFEFRYGKSLDPSLPERWDRLNELFLAEEQAIPLTEPNAT
jgi:hypothetical protein